MATYLAETYLSRERSSDLEAIAGRLRDVLPVRHLFSSYVAADETAFHWFEAPSPDSVRRVLERAGFAADRIVDADPILGPGPHEGTEPDASPGP